MLQLYQGPKLMLKASKSGCCPRRRATIVRKTCRELDVLLSRFILTLRNISKRKRAGPNNDTGYDRIN